MAYNDTRHSLKGNAMYTELAKSVATLVASAGVGAIVTNAVKATTPDNLKIATKISIVIGTFVASHAVGDVASSYCGKQIDELNNAVGKARKFIKSTKN